MGRRTSVDEAAARALIGEYGLELERIVALPAHGTVNSNFRVRASGAEYFLRINEGKTDGDAEAEAALIATLRARGLRTPQVLPTADGRPLARFRGKPVTLFPWLAAREADPDPRSAASVEVVGRALADLHLRGGAANEASLPRNHYSLDELEARLQRFTHEPRLLELAPDLPAELTAELARARRRTALPSGLIHQDLFPDNLLVDDTGDYAAILDLEQATWGRFVYDLAVAVNSWCWDGERIVDAAKDAVTAAYQSVRPLSDLERSAFVDEARLAAARFTITRVTDVFLPEGIDPSLRARKDFRDYARRLAFWKATSSRG